MNILHVPSGLPEKTQTLGPYRIETLIPKHEEGRATAYRVRIEPHSVTSVSYHKLAEELYFVLSGSGIAILNGQRFLLKTGDLLRLPPGTTHGFETGEEALEMLDVHTPGCWPDRDVYFVGETPPGFA